MTKYLVIGNLEVCGVKPGGVVDGSTIPNVELLLQACAIAPIPDPKSKEVEKTNGEASFN